MTRSTITYQTMLWRCCVGLLACWFTASLAHAESVRFYDLEGFGKFLDGNPESTAVTEDGAVGLPPPYRERWADTTAAIACAAGWQDKVAVAKVDDGQILTVDAQGRVAELFKVQESMVTAMLSTPKGLLVAVGTPAKIYQIDSTGKAHVWVTLSANYIWGMALGADDTVYAVTGDPGLVLQIDSAGHARELFRADQLHLRAVAFDADTGLFVGGGERGIVYRRAPKSQAFKALFDTGHTEITALLVRQGQAFVAGVTGAANLLNEDPAKRPPGKAVEIRSNVVRLNLDGSSDMLAGSNDEAVFAMAFDAAGHVMVATGATGRDDPRGRLYTIDPNKRLISLVYQAASRRITHLVPLEHNKLAAVTAASARIIELQPGVAKQGEFFTQPFDAGINASYGLVHVLGSIPKGTSIQVALRSGQTMTPDASWSAWGHDITAPEKVAAAIPNGRYMQARLTLRGTGEASPLLHRLRVAYLRQNLPPFVREVTSLRKGIALQSLPRDENKIKLVGLADKSEESGNEELRRAANVRVRQIPDRNAITIKWTADDPNLDELRFDLWLRSMKEDTWQLLASSLTEPFYVFKSNQLPNGYYQFRVRATDALSNPAGLERTDTRESRAVLIDNTPPVIDKLKVVRRATHAVLQAHVSDAVGPLVELTYSLDTQAPRLLTPVDGILDGPQEVLDVDLGELPKGEHRITVRAVDESDNEGFAETFFSVP